MTTFSVIIPNYNGQRFLPVCFESLKNQSHKNFEIILVDNNSTDDSIVFTKRYYPQVKIIKIKNNGGFALAVNAGIKKSTGELIALLNNDTKVDRNWLKEMKKVADQCPSVDFFASKMLDFYDHTIIDSCGICLTWSGRSFNNFMTEKDCAKCQKDAYVFGACAGAAVYRKEIFDQVGLFDEDFFMYVEDVDFSFRAQLMGFRCLYVSGAKVYHIGSASSGGKQNPLSFKLCARNRWYLIYKNFPSQKIWANIFKIKYSEIRYFFAAFKHHFVKEYFWAVKSGFGNFSKIAKKRRKIQRGRAVSIEYLDQIIQKGFDYKPVREMLNIRQN